MNDTPDDGMMEQKQNSSDPVSKSSTDAGDAPSKQSPADHAKASGAASATGKTRSAEIIEEPDDGVEPPAHPVRNQLREYRIENMMSKAELARKAGLSVLTVARIEKGYDCRMDTKRKLLKALGLKLADRRKVFEDE
jgi:DNA-binding XRE family transcriptional regulator